MHRVSSPYDSHSTQTDCFLQSGVERKTVQLIHAFKSLCYLTACEAAWRLLSHHVAEKSHLSHTLNIARTNSNVIKNLPRPPHITCGACDALSTTRLTIFIMRKISPRVLPNRHRMKDACRVQLACPSTKIFTCGDAISISV